MTPAPIRVLIVDDHPIVRNALSDLLNGADDIRVVGAAADGEEAVVTAAEENPDIVLMDLSMPGMDGIEATRRIIAGRPDARVLMLTSFSGHERIVGALKAGAVGYMLKDAKPEEVLRGIRSAARAAGQTAP